MGPARNKEEEEHQHQERRQQQSGFSSFAARRFSSSPRGSPLRYCEWEGQTQYEEVNSQR